MTEWVVDELDVRIAERLRRLTAPAERRTGATTPDVADDPLLTLAALAAAAPRGGHVCVDLATVTGDVVLQRPSPTGAGPRPAPEPLAPVGRVDQLLRDAVASGLARRGDDPAGTAPLVVDDTRAYLDRYWSYEDRLRHELVTRTARTHTPDDPAVVRGVLDTVAAHDGTGPAVDRQRLAVANALLRPVSVISGGPGTGKTHTVVSLVAGHVLLAAARDRPTPRVAIAAPTGKAAARMEQAIAEAVGDRGLPDEVAAVVGELRGRTIHRLLGTQRWAPTRFRHDAGRPLRHDVVVVDEASMVPLALMTKLVEAVRPDATLVLVGDRNQLTSVEAGAVLGDVCGPLTGRSTLRLSDEWADVLAEVADAPVGRERDPMPVPGVWDGIVQLERFRRFGSDSGIGAVARAVQRVDRDASRVVDLLTGDAVEESAPVERYDDVELVAPDPGPALPRSLHDEVVGVVEPYLDAVEAAAGATHDRSVVEHARAALVAMDEVRVLCAVREGPLGVERTGALVESWVAARRSWLDPGEEWYEGRPVLVTRNDHDLGVMNGDVGVTLRRDGRLVVAFQLADGSIRLVPALRVADCETVWAMTIHKSQGSQFRHAIVVLPERDNEVVTRELVYTGITRAERRATVVASPQRLADAVARPVRRATGLRQRLWRTDTSG